MHCSKPVMWRCGFLWTLMRRKPSTSGPRRSLGRVLVGDMNKPKVREAFRDAAEFAHQITRAFGKVVVIGGPRATAPWTLPKLRFIGQRSVPPAQRCRRLHGARVWLSRRACMRTVIDVASRAVGHAGKGLGCCGVGRLRLFSRRG